MHRYSHAAVTVILFCAVILVSAYALNSADAAGDAASIVQALGNERGQGGVPIIDPKNEMRWFYQALARTAAKQPGAMTRVAHYGDSIVEMDLISGQARRRLQNKWGDGGHGFVLAGRPKPWYRPYDIHFRPGAKWITFDLRDDMIADRRVGLGGVYAISYKKKASSEFGTVRSGVVGTKVSRFEILFPVEPQGGEIEVEVDGDYRGKLITRSAEKKDAYTVINVPDGRHELEIKALQKNTRLYGVILERQGPGVVYDALGINGIGLGYYLKIDRAHWMAQLRHRNPNLIVLGFGQNEARFGDQLNEQNYRNDVTQLVTTIKEALPHTSILLFSPIDQAIKQGTQIITRPAIPRIVQIHKELAAELGIAYWNIFEAMGGEGAMVRWHNANPRLGAGDFAHPTAEGGEVLGNKFYYALMQGFAAYLQAQGMPAGTTPRPNDSLVRMELVQ